MTPEEVITHKDFERIAKSALSRRSKPADIEEEDLIQEIRLRILKYGCGDDLKLTTIIYNHAKWCINDILKGKKRHKFLSSNSMEFFVVDKNSRNLEKELTDKEECDELYSNLTNRQIQVLNFVKQGYTPIEIVEKLGSTKQNISGIINSAREKIHATYY